MSDETVDRSKLPIRRPPFTGVTAKTLDGSKPDREVIGSSRPTERRTSWLC